MINSNSSRYGEHKLEHTETDKLEWRFFKFLKIKKKREKKKRIENLYIKELLISFSYDIKLQYLSFFPVHVVWLQPS